MDIASLGIKVTTDGVTQAESDLNKLEKTGAKVEKSTSTISKGFKENAKTAKELRFALRGVPAQFTDIATSLAQGQRPLQVLLQQGGQLKDMFGGIGPAARALGGYVVGLINPFTLAAAAAAGLAYASYRGSQDIVELNDALDKTGGYAGVAARDLNAMAVKVGAATGEFGDARDAVNQLTGSGQFSGLGLSGLAKQAVDTAKVTGQSMDDVVKSIAKLNAKPAETIAALNEQYHFLTSAQYAQIAALEEQGRTQEAARLANKLDAEAMAERAQEVENNANWIVKSAHWVAKEWGIAWSAVKGAVTPAGLAEQAADLQAQIEALSKPRVDRKGNLVQGANGEEIARLKAELADVRRQQVQQAFADSERALEAGLNQDAIAAQRRLAEFASPKDKRDNEIAKANRDHLAALYGIVDPDERAKIDAEWRAQVKAANDAYTNATKGKRSVFDQPIIGDTHANLTKSIQADIAGYKAVFDQQSKNTVGLMQYTDAMDKRIATERAAAQLQVESIGLGQHQIEIRQQIIAIERESNRDLEKLNREFADKSFGMTQADYDARLKVIKAKEAERVQIVMDTDRQIAAARGDASLGAQKALADFTDSAGDVAGQTAGLFSNAFDGMGDAIAKFVETGKLDFSDLANSIIADLARMEARILVSQALQSIFGQSTATTTDLANEGINAQIGRNTAAINWQPNALGGVYNSQSLSAYSGQIVDKPTLFAFARGAGIFGEAGPEAIMPLRRGPDGKLGVQASGGGDVEVVVNVNNNGQPVQARQTGTRRDGQRVIVDMVLDAVAGDIASGGKTAKAMQQRFGVQRRGAPVGG